MTNGYMQPVCARQVFALSANTPPRLALQHVNSALKSALGVLIRDYPDAVVSRCEVRPVTDFVALDGVDDNAFVVLVTASSASAKPE